MNIKQLRVLGRARRKVSGIGPNNGPSSSLLGSIDRFINTGMGKVAHSDMNMAGAVAGGMNATKAAYARTADAIGTVGQVAKGIATTPGMTPEHISQLSEAGVEMAGRAGGHAWDTVKAAGGTAAAAGKEYWRWMNGGGMGDKAWKYGATAAAAGISYGGVALTGNLATHAYDAATGNSKI